MKISLIAALGKNGVLGLDNKLLWHIPEDFKHFKRVTMGHTIIMGRKTFESIGKPLPGRKTIVLSNSDIQLPAGVELFKSLEAALEYCRGLGLDEVFVCGGGQVYQQALMLADKLYLSFVDIDIQGDTYFPNVNWKEWKLLTTQEYKKAQGGPFDWEFKLFEKIV